MKNVRIRGRTKSLGVLQECADSMKEIEQCRCALINRYAECLLDQLTARNRGREGESSRSLDFGVRVLREEFDKEDKEDKEFSDESRAKD